MLSHTTLSSESVLVAPLYVGMSRAYNQPLVTAGASFFSFKHLATPSNLYTPVADLEYLKGGFKKCNGAFARGHANFSYKTTPIFGVQKFTLFS